MMLTIREAKEKIGKYCAYRDRSHKEVREKLFSYGLTTDESDEIMIELIRHDFLNEERYTRSFIRGKFRMNQWGRNKIRHALNFQEITEKLITRCMSEIPESDYIDCMKSLMHEKMSRLKKSENLLSRRQKVAKYLMNKGYEADLVWEHIKSEFPD